MNELFERFIRDYFDDCVSDRPEEVVKKAHKAGVDSIDSLVDFLLSVAGFHERIYSARKTKQFFASMPQYADIYNKILEKAAEADKVIDKIKRDPSTDLVLAYFLSNNFRGIAVGSTPDDVPIELASIAGDSYADVERIGLIPESKPILLFFFRSIDSVRRHHFSEFPILMLNGDLIKAKELLRRTRRMFERSGRLEDYYGHPLLGSGTPILAYDYGNDLILGTPEFKGRDGQAFWAQNSHSARSIFYVKDGVIHEYKGARIDILSENRFPLSLTPPGTCSLDAVNSEVRAVNELADVLPYKVNPTKLGLTAPVISLESHDEKVPLELAVLKREGHLNEFAPHLRIHYLEFMPYSWLLTDYNFDFDKAFYSLGCQLGTAHRRSVYPRFSGTDNIDIFGNLVDLEGAITHESFWKMFSGWSAKNVFYTDGNPLLMRVRVEYERLQSEEEYSVRPKIIREMPGESAPKDWKELRELINKYGVKIFELPTFFNTLISLDELFASLEPNRFLRDRIPKFFNAFLDGYSDAYRETSAYQLVEAVRGLQKAKESNQEGSHQFSQFLDMRTAKVPYVILPDNFQFVDRKDTLG